MSYFYIILITLIAYLMTTLGYLALRRNKKSLTNQLFFSFTFLVSIWSLVNFFENIVSFDIAEILLRVDFFMGPFILFVLMMFLFNFPDENKKLSKKLIWTVIPAIIFSFLSLGDKVIFKIEKTSLALNFSFGQLFIFYTITLFAYLLGGAIFQVINYKKFKGIKKMQIKYLLFGLFVSTLIVLIFNIFLQNIVSLQIFRLGYFGIIVFIVCIYYAIVRYRLMNITRVLRLGTVYTILLSIISSIFVFVNYFLINQFNVGSPWNFIIPSLLITIGFDPLKKVIEGVTDKVFFKKEYDYATVMKEIEAKLHVVSLDVDLILKNINEIIFKTLKPTESIIKISIPGNRFMLTNVISDENKEVSIGKNNSIFKYLKYKKTVIDVETLERELSESKEDLGLEKKVIKEMKKNHLSIVVPIEAKEELIGMYLLGPKKSQDHYSSTDLELLDHIAWETGFVINNAVLYTDLKRLDEVKSNFIKVTSHQLRTPITSAQYNLELSLEKGVSVKEKNEAIKSAYSSLHNLNKQYNELMIALDIEERKLNIEKDEISLKEIIDNYFKQEYVKKNFKNVKVVLNKEDEDIKLSCDREKIEKTLNILLDNAINYSQENDQVKLFTYMDSSEDNKKSVVFSVEDNGIGVPLSNSVEIFKKFFRCPEAISKSPNGLGIGLFIAKNFVKLHGGDIWFENKEEGGTKFMFSIPVK